jgi:glycerophosphoryl diester phosphodiesterase
MAVCIVAHGGRVDGGKANSIEGLRECIRAGVRRVEIDVRSQGSELILGHDEPPPDHPTEAASGALALAGSFDWIMLDLKEPGAARLAAEAVGRLDPERFVFASTQAGDLTTVRSILPGATTSLSFPNDPSHPRWLRPAYLAAARLALPAVIASRVRRHRPTQLTLNQRFVTRPALAVARRLGCRVYVWTVDDPARARSLAAQGVAGIITNRPLAIAETLRLPVESSPD